VLDGLNLNGIVRLDPAKITAGGFDQLVLRSRSADNLDGAAARIRLEGDIQLALAQRLVLDAPVLASDGGHAKLTAAYVQMGTPLGFYNTEVKPQDGDGSLLVQGQHVDLIGTLALRGFGADGTGATGATPVRIESDGDIRFIGGKEISAGGAYRVGRLNSAADVTLRADQVYTATATDFTLSVAGDDGLPAGRITIESGGAGEAPLSAGSKLTLTAARIEQHGTLRAPFGQINLDAKEKLVLGAGSITSVSGDGQVVPFGRTEFGGQDWLYPIADNSSNVYQAPPEKRITLTAPQVTLDAGSVVDVTGGGDLLAREQVPGPGGSNDILNNTLPDGTPNNAFALVPTQSNLFGSYDPFLSQDSPVKPGDTLHLAGGGPLPAGEYAMLPAGYALLPGAYLVTPLASTDSPMPGQALPQFDGSAIVAGQRGVAGTGSRDSLWSAFRIENGTQVRNRAEYLERRADSFFSADTRLNQDAGRLVIDASTALTLGGTLAGNASGGRGSEVDILATNLALVASHSGAGDRVELLASDLNQLNADSLLLGAARQHQGADVALDVRAENVTIESGAAVAAPEVMLAARERVSVADGASISATDGERTRAPKTIQLTDDSALARISSGEQVRVERHATSGTAPGTSGTINVAAGAVLDAARSITLDASRDTVVDGDLRTHNGSLSLAAASVSLGETQGVTGGLVLSNDDLARLSARDLTLNSRSAIHLHGRIALDADRIVLDAAGLAGYANTGEGASIEADTIALSNRAGVSFTGSPPNGSGTLALSAREVTLGEGSFALRGFSDSTIAATQQIVARPETGTPAELHVAGNLTLDATRISASPGADVLIDTRNATGALAGKITLAAPAAPASLAPVTDLGGKLEIAASTIEHGGRIELPSGVVSLHATEGDVRIAPGASIDVSGRDLAFADITVGSPGGQATLIADAGNVDVGAGARIDVAGATSGGDAGKISISAPQGAVRLDPAAELAGAAHAGARTASFALDAQTLTSGFSPLNAALNASGFTDGRQFRLRTGDMAIAAEDTVKAHDLRIAADAGRIDVYGRIDASGTQAGQVALYARDDVSLHGPASIDAHATGTDQQGGTVTLGSTAGSLDLQVNASIDVAGTDAAGARADSGTLRLRAARVGAGVAVNPIATDIVGAGRVDIEAYKTYTTERIDSALINTIQGDTGAFMANAGQIKGALGADARLHLLPGVEIRSPGDLTLETEWDLLGWRDGGEPGVLSLRAAGDLNLNAALSDGVALVPPVSGFEELFAARAVVQTGPSWSYRLAGGADLAGVDPLAAMHGVGDITVAAGTTVRTGTGSIELAAGRDIRYADSTAAIYTVGENRGVGAMPSGDISAEVNKELYLKGDFLHNGGDIHITAGRDVIGADSHQFVSEWLSRVGGIDNRFIEIDLPVAWAIDVTQFRQNIGALGGGNVTLAAGGDIDNLSVVIPTTAQPVVATPGTAPSIAGGGDLRIETGGDVRSGVFYLGKGQADIAAGGSVTRATGSPVYPILALGDGQYVVRARQDLVIESVVNPTVLAPSAEAYYPEFIPVPPEGPYFFTYTDDSALRLVAIAGDAVLRADADALKNTSAILKASDPAVLGYFPGTLGVRSLQGDVVLGGQGFTLLPVPHGNIELLAKGNITSTSDSTTVHLSDADADWLPSVVAPSKDLTETRARLATARTDEGKGPDIHAATPVHLGDTQPARIVAQTGTLGSLADSLNKLTFYLPKQARFYAGEDVRNLTLNIQQVDAGDISVVEARKNILFQTQRDDSGVVDASDAKKFEIAGPGQFYLIAGEDIDLGASQGVVSSGDQKNPALADSGAGITLMAGMQGGADYAAFIQKYLADSSAYEERLAQFMTGLGAGSTGVDGFRALPLVQQRKFILGVLFNELRASGIDAAQTGNTEDYEPGYAAIKTLFPAGRYAGDVKSFLSRIYTLDGGDINLVVPGGLVNAGVAGIEKKNKEDGGKGPGELGIVVQRDGDINAFVHADVLVNEARVFALDGGDILMWSSSGDIDAGKGAKTALSIPPPTATPDEDGNIVVEFPPAISGSGIRAAVATPGREPGNVYLIAPVGVIDAGDAGIGAAGNLTVAASAVIGADNIQVSGIATGVPTDTGGLGASLAGVGDIAATANKVAEDATRGLGAQTNENQTFLGVEVIGFGE
jgi:hypothetical protein